MNDIIDRLARADALISTGARIAEDVARWYDLDLSQARGQSFFRYAVAEVL